jgi:lathosterol oxidase
MTLVFVPVERLWPLHPDQGLPARVDNRCFLFRVHAPARATDHLRDAVTATYASKWLAIPALMKTLAACLYGCSCRWRSSVADFSQYATHRAFHRIPFLWRFHAIHHSIKTMDWIAGSRSHFVDILVTRGLILIPMTLSGFSQSAMAGYLIFVSFHATFCHTDFRRACAGSSVTS